MVDTAHLVLLFYSFCLTVLMVIVWRIMLIHAAEIERLRKQIRDGKEKTNKPTGE